MIHPFNLKSSQPLAPRIFPTIIKGLYYLDHPVHLDSRGYFAEMAIIDDLNQILPHPFLIRQVNLAYSKANVCRGIHAEAWNKLICPTTGSIFSAIVDLRPKSATYQQVVTFNLGCDPKDLPGCLFISQGLGNSYCVKSGPCHYFYCVDALYRDRDPKRDSALSLFDPKLKIPWPLTRQQMMLSPRDLVD